MCVRASVKLVDSTTARITFGIVPVSLDELKREYLEHLDKPGYPNILFQKKDIPIVILAKDDWELPSPVVPLHEMMDENHDLPEPTTSVAEVGHLSDNPIFEASPSYLIWPLYTEEPSQSGSGDGNIDIP